MQANIHLADVDEKQYHPHFAGKPAFKADVADTYTALDVNDGDGGQVVVFVSTLEQAQLLVEAAIEIRHAFRLAKDEVERLDPVSS